MPLTCIFYRAVNGVALKSEDAIWIWERHPTKLYRKKEIVAADFDFSLQFPKVRLI